MIVATAGHIDHGKTQLIKALTGVDTDRLAEEKKRGLTIDIGFAYLPLDNDQNIGFIDVPGHNRFIRNAICGLAATDFVLFIVAADDGVMPQTKEHLAIIDLLKVKQGAIAVSKTDCVSAAQLETVKQQVNHLVENTIAAQWPIFAVSSLSNEGIGVLRDYLVDKALAEKHLDDAVLLQNNFRMPIDRVFNLKGVGLVATGTIFAGRVRQGDTVTVGGSNKRLRVRGLKVQNRDAEFGVLGQRCAVNLAGSDLQKGLIKRGSWVTAETVSSPVYRFDAEIRILDSVERPLKHWTPVHLHHAASESTARVAVLGSRAIRPSTSGLVQIVSDHPIGASFDDYFVIRDQSARTTIGGGQVIDIYPPRRGRAKPQRIELLRRLNQSNAETVLQSLLTTNNKDIDLKRFVANRNLTSESASKLFERLNIKTGNRDKARSDYVEKHSEQTSIKADPHWLEIEAVLMKTGLNLQRVDELADRANLASNQCQSLLMQAVHEGLLIKCSAAFFILPNILLELRDTLHNLLEQTNGFSVAQFRDASGLGRNRSIEILEWFDRLGITQRIDQRRQWHPLVETRFEQLLNNHHQSNGKDRTLVGRPVFKTGGGR